MERVVCKKCGSIDYEVIKKGVHTGLYCKDCGKWIKWQKKKEIIKRICLYSDSGKEFIDGLREYFEEY